MNEYDKYIDQENNLILFSIISTSTISILRIGFWMAFYYVTKKSITWDTLIVVLEFLFVYGVSFTITMLYVMEVRKRYVGKFSKIQNWLNEIKEYNKNIREQKSKNQELFEPEQSTNIYHEILDEDLEDDLNCSWAHYESKRK